MSQAYIKREETIVVPDHIAAAAPATFEEPLDLDGMRALLQERHTRS